MIRAQQRALERLQASVSETAISPEQLEEWARSPVTQYVIDNLSLDSITKSDELLSSAPDNTSDNITACARYLAGWDAAIADIEANIDRFLGKVEVEDDE